MGGREGDIQKISHLIVYKTFGVLSSPILNRNSREICRNWHFFHNVQVDNKANSKMSTRFHTLKEPIQDMLVLVLTSYCVCKLLVCILYPVVWQYSLSQMLPILDRCPWGSWKIRIQARVTAAADRHLEWGSSGLALLPLRMT